MAIEVDLLTTSQIQEQFKKVHPFAFETGIGSLYKYFSFDPANPDRLEEILLGNRLYHPLPSQLNDPWECRPFVCLEDSPEALIRAKDHLSRLLHDKGIPEAEAKTVLDTRFKEAKDLQKTLDGSVQNVFQEMRLCSFTAVPENLLMWAHYGACLLYTSPSPRDLSTSRMPSSA